LLETSNDAKPSSAKDREWLDTPAVGKEIL
jgi:hypothetical protein